jgi:protein-L-isoaspartate O-methyltransferase
VDGAALGDRWPAAAYRDASLVTQVGRSHADHVTPGDTAEGIPASSSTKPGLVVTMYRHAMIGDGMDVLDVGTGSGYGTALLCGRLGDRHVSSIDIDPYLTAVARERLAGIGLRPAIATADATGPLRADYDRIVSMTSVAPVPAPWLAALRPGGRLVFTVARTGLLVTADKTPDGGAAGRVEWHRAGFMPARTGHGYPPDLLATHPQARDGDGDVAGGSAYPVPREWSWDLHSNLAILVPGIEDHYETAQDGTRRAWLLAPDGSWARAEGRDGGPVFICQAGPQRLWDILDGLRGQWLREGSLPAYGSDVTIAPDGSITFKRGKWTAVLPAPARRPGTTPATTPGDRQDTREESST